MSRQPREARCTRCGCTDSMACSGGCYWLVVDRRTGKGLCSKCGPETKTGSKRDRQLRRAA